MMGNHRISSVAVFLLLAYAVDLVCCVTVEFYSGQNYSGFLDKKTFGPSDEKKCIPLGTSYNIRSMKTDRCVMIYESWDCTHYDHSGMIRPDYSTLYSVRIDNDVDHFDVDYAYTYRDDNRNVASFHVCSQALGGGERLDVDLYDRILYLGNQYKSWRGVCDCENIPTSLVGNAKSIDNHGNSMYIYAEEHCRGEGSFIPAGDSATSRYLYDPTNNFRSFRAAQYLDCLQLDASIYKFSFSNGTTAQPKTENVQLATTQTLINQGKLPMTQTIEFSDTIGNTVEYSVAKAFTETHSAGVKVGVSTETSAGLEFLAEEKIKISLEANYQYTNTHQGTVTNKTTATDSKMIKISSVINVAACEKCDVSGYVKVVRDFPVSYTAESMLSGTGDGRKLTAEEVRSYIPPGMAYIKDYDGYSVEVSVDGTMVADFAWNTFLSKNCVPVPDCNPHPNALPQPSHEIQKVPFFVI